MLSLLSLVVALACAEPVVNPDSMRTALDLALHGGVGLGEEDGLEHQSNAFRLKGSSDLGVLTVYTRGNVPQRLDVVRVVESERMVADAGLEGKHHEVRVRTYELSPTGELLAVGEKVDAAWRPEGRRLQGEALYGLGQELATKIEAAFQTNSWSGLVQKLKAAPRAGSWGWRATARSADADEVAARVQLRSSMQDAEFSAGGDAEDYLVQIYMREPKRVVPLPDGTSYYDKSAYTLTATQDGEVLRLEHHLTRYTDGDQRKAPSAADGESARALVQEILAAAQRP